MATAVAVQPFQEPSRNNDLMNLFESCATSFFGPCEDTCQQASRTVFWEPASPAKTDDRIHSLDFESLHDQFLESLLHEAAALRGEEDEESSQVPNDTLFRKHSSMSEETTNSRKRRRPMRLSRRRTPPRIRKPVLSDQHSNASTEHSKSSSTSVTISLADLSKSNLPKPETYLHGLVRMQKDKGKGEPVGSNLCAKGRDACLEKLRDKMRLLTEVATEKSTGASMKIRKARTAEQVDNFVETRSLINLRMGFLSMTYGILLRWDTTKTGTITLVVLRKMCHESFYPDATRVPSTVSTASRDNALGTSEENSAYRKLDDMEFAPLDPPFRLEPPEFTEAVLSVTVVSVTGVSKKSNWTASLSIGDTAENVLLQWDSSKRFLSPKAICTLRHLTGERLRWGPNSALQIKLFENRIRRRIPRRLTDSIMLPLTRLRPQRSPGRPSRITVPCKHDPEARVVLDVTWQSDYAVWASREMQARQHQIPVAAPISVPSQSAVSAEEQESHDPWDWICFVC